MLLTVWDVSKVNTCLFAQNKTALTLITNVQCDFSVRTKAHGDLSKFELLQSDEISFSRGLYSPQYTMVLCSEPSIIKSKILLVFWNPFSFD